MNKKKKWNTNVPANGWYWIRYKGKHGRVVCPCSVQHFGSEYVAHTARNDVFTKATRTTFGFSHAEFGPVILPP